MTELATPIRSQAESARARDLRTSAPGRQGPRGRRQRYRGRAGCGRRAHRAHDRGRGKYAGLLQESRSDRARLAQRLVPYRRRVPARRGRQLLLRRPHEGRDPPARREHLVVRGGDRACAHPDVREAAASRRAERVRRGRSAAVVVAGRRQHVDPAALLRSSCRAWRATWCRATSASSPSCRRRRRRKSRRSRLRSEGRHRGHLGSGGARRDRASIRTSQTG